MNKIAQETRELIVFFRDYIRKDFDLLSYLLILIFCSIGIYCNVYHQIEDRYVDVHYGKWIRCFYYFLMYATFYYGSVLILLVNPDFRKKISVKFILVSCLGLCLISLNSGISWHHDFLRDHFNRKNFYYVLKIVVNIQRVFTWLVPFLLIYFFSKNWRPSNFYGLSFKNFHFRPYLVLYAAMIPIILVAANTSSFLDYYPTLNINRLQGDLAANKTLYFIIYEAIYGFDFTMVELMFRGFLVIGLSKLIDRHAIIPMAVLYMAFHFGKPTPEAISSLFGGYLLGILAFQSKNILGGIAIHAGIALLMDISSYWLKFGLGLNQ